jgi:FkbM family methyltransferase
MNLKQLEYLQPKTILDIGANVGAWSLEAKEVWKDADILMIEGNPACETALRYIYQTTGISYVIGVLSDKTGWLPFYQRKGCGTSTGDSIYRENTDWYSDENVEIVQYHAVAIDEMFGNTGIYAPKFDLVKIDVQGAELDVLRGGKDIFKSTKYIIMEVIVDGIEPYNIGSPSRAEVMEYITSIGFKPQTVLENIVHPIERHIIQQDILFSK